MDQNDQPKNITFWQKIQERMEANLSENTLRNFENPFYWCFLDLKEAEITVSIHHFMQLYSTDVFTEI